MTITDVDIADLPGYREILYYQALLSSIDEIVISTDTDFIIQSWNTAAEKIYKINAPQAIGRRTTDLLLHEYINTTRDEVIRKLLKESYWKGVVKVKTGNETIFLQSSFKVVKNAKGIKIGYIGVSKNVTEEIYARQSLQNFASVLTLLEESFLIVDTDYKIAFMRPKGNVQNFFNSDYKVGDNAFKYIPANYYNEVKSCYERAFNGETLNYDATSEGEKQLHFNVTYAPLKDDFGNISSVCVIIKDFTEKKELELLHQRKASVERSLFESRHLFEDFMQNSPLLAWVTDAGGYIQYMNPPYLKSYAFTDAVIGKSIYDLYSKEVADEYFENNKKVIETGKPVETIERDRVSNENRNYKVIKFPIYYKGRNMIAGWAVDISTQMETLESLSLLNQHKNKLVSLIAHDLRGPIGINLSFLNSIVNDYSLYTSEELLNSLQLIAKSSANCFELIDDLLRWAKSQLGGAVYNPASVNIQTEVLKIVDSLLDQIRQKKIKLITNFSYCNNVYVDHDMFAIVLRNFITNAIKFSYEGGEVCIKTSLYNNKAKISVQDYGTGMSAALVKKLLGKLNHESVFGTKGEKGSGLGLFMAKDYIDQNGGTMSIESRQGKGSDFGFTVPLSKNHLPQVVTEPQLTL